MSPGSAACGCGVVSSQGLLLWGLTSNYLMNPLISETPWLDSELEQEELEPVVLVQEG